MPREAMLRILWATLRPLILALIEPFQQTIDEAQKRTNERIDALQKRLDERVSPKE